MKIEELDISVRTYNCLKRAGINTVEELEELDVLYVKRIRGLGKKSFEDLLYGLEKVWGRKD